MTSPCLMANCCPISQEFADIVVRCNDGGELKAHRAVLGIASPVFRCMLNSPMKEGGERQRANSIGSVVFTLVQR